MCVCVGGGGASVGGCTCVYMYLHVWYKRYKVAFSRHMSVLCLFPGTKNGLHLQLNIEQYEYLRLVSFEHFVPAGIMLRVHDGDESPNARISGMAISPGAHAFVSVKASEVNIYGHFSGMQNMAMIVR